MAINQSKNILDYVWGFEKFEEIMWERLVDGLKYLPLETIVQLDEKLENHGIPNFENGISYFIRHPCYFTSQMFDFFEKITGVTMMSLIPDLTLTKEEKTYWARVYKVSNQNIVNTMHKGITQKVDHLAENYNSYGSHKKKPAFQKRI